MLFLWVIMHSLYIELVYGIHSFFLRESGNPIKALGLITCFREKVCGGWYPGELRIRNS